MLPLRSAVKSLRRSPGFATVSILSLAVALGLVAAVFGLVDGLRNPRTATRNPEQLFRVVMKGTGTAGTVTAADLIEVIETRMPTVNQVAFETYGPGEAVFEKDIRLETRGARVSANWFSVRGVRPIVGRVFSDATADEDAIASVVISERIWKAVFDSDKRLERLSLSIEGAAETRQVQVIGVVPLELTAETFEDYWLSLPRDVKALARTTRGIGTVVRLHPGKTHDSLNVDLAAAAAWLTSLHGSGRAGFGFSAFPMARDPLNISAFEWLLIGAAIA